MRKKWNKKWIEILSNGWKEIKFSLINPFAKIINVNDKYVYEINILKDDILVHLKFIEIDLDDCNKYINE